MTYILETPAYGVMCTATTPNRQKPIQDKEIPSSVRKDGLELFGEAARKLGEQGPAQKHGDDTD